MYVAAVLGGAAGGLDELASVPHDAVIAVNDAAAEYRGPLFAFVTLHPEKLPLWLAKRRALGLPDPDEVIAHEPHPMVTRVADYRFPGMNASGSSGLFAVKIALDWFDDVVLCGVPMDPVRTHYAESSFRNDAGSFLDAWQIAKPHLTRVRSCSGWTAELLGRPV